MVTEEHFYLVFSVNVKENQKYRCHDKTELRRPRQDLDYE